MLKYSFLQYVLIFFIVVAGFKGFTQNNPPNLQYDVSTADQNTTLNVPSGAPDNYLGLLANDSDPDGDALMITLFIVNGTTYPANSTANLAEGQLTINADGTYRFVPTPGFTGYVPDITYEVSDGTTTSRATLYMTVETAGDLLGVPSISSCNQGYTLNGLYKIRYIIQIRNESITRGYHQNSEITNIQLFEDLNAIFGVGCITEIERNNLYANSPDDFIGGNYPIEWNILHYDQNEFDDTDATPGAQGIFIASSNTNILYPNQSIYLDFCIYIDPNCAASDPIDFDNIVSATSSRGNTVGNFEITNFHTSETTVAANLYIPSPSPIVNFDGTYDYTNTVIITNDGTATATNVNFNMGLQSFVDNGIVFSSFDHDNDVLTPDKQTPYVRQVDATGIEIATIAINPTFNGILDAKLLDIGQSLNAGETIYLEIVHHLSPIPTTSNNYFYSHSPSMSQGALDGFDENSGTSSQYQSYVIWDDALGNHLDRYYNGTSTTDEPSSDDQCLCETLSMEFLFSLTLQLNKTIVSVNPAPSGILEHKEVTFNIRALNEAASNVRIVDLVVDDNLLGICMGNVISISTPNLISPTNATEIPEVLPNLNPAYDGVTDIHLFDGVSGILNPGEFFDIQITVVIADDCIGNNTASLSGNDPLNVNSGITASVAVSIFSDTDNDGITNIIDIDDDNDGIPDIIEYAGLDPLQDDDADNIPNYRDTDYGIDINNDGIVDIFDFDMDGVANHLDLDSDNDGIYDIVESANGALDTNNNGRTNNLVGANGLDDTIEDNDTALATINVALIPNTDASGNFDYLDIDADADGIVDNIEAQATNMYIAPNTIVDVNGLLYNTGLIPVDTDLAIGSDNIPDYQDTNSDDDVRDDFIEGWDLDNNGIPETLVVVPADSDNDGLDDVYDVDDSQINPTNGQTPLSFPNVDDANTPERDWRELMAIVVTITNEQVTEGGILTFKVELKSMNNLTISVPSATDTDIVIFTNDGTDITTQYEIATAPFDYLSIDNTPVTTITIPAGTTSLDVIIQTNEDTIDELTELFTLNAAINLPTIFNTEAKGIGTIVDNDNPPDIEMNDSIANEGIPLQHVVMISPTSVTTSSSIPIVIDITTTDFTAINPNDYTSFLGTVTIPGTIDPANENTQIAFDITTIIDNLNEVDEEYILVNGIVTSNNVGLQDLNKRGTIVDIDPDPTVTISSPTVIEGNELQFDISLSNLNDSDTIITIFTTNGTANEPLDYTALTTQITIPAFALEATIIVMTIDDVLSENTENLTLNGLVITFNTDNINPTNLGTILDNDIPNLFSPNNDGLSDVFEIRSLQAYPNFSLQIFDRWGSVIHKYENQARTQPEWWNGERKGSPVPEGVYYYTLEYNDGITAPKSGFVQLIR